MDAETKYRSGDALGRLFAFGLAFSFLAVALGVSFLVTPEDIDSGRVLLSPTCAFKSVTGHECLTCGMTRAFAALSHGRLSSALGYNRGSPIVYLGFWMAAAATVVAMTRALGDYRRARSAAPNAAKVPGGQAPHAGNVGSADAELADHAEG